LANKANGFGISYLNQDLINYQGDFINDKRHGIGIDYLEGKISYKGEFKNDGRSGVGSILYGENAFYLGEWKTGMQNGFVKYLIYFSILIVLKYKIYLITKYLDF